MAKKKKPTTGTGEEQGLIGRARHDIAAGYNDVGEALSAANRFGNKLGKEDPLNILGIGKKGKAAPKKAGGKKGGTTTSSAPTATQLEQEIANDPWSQLGKALTTQLQQEQVPIEKAISGGDTASTAQAATTQALADAGLAPNSSAAQWLTSNMNQAQANDAPMAQAMNAYGQAYAAGQQGVNTALTGMGQANQLGVATAPEQTWLGDLATHIQSNLAYSGTVPSWAQNLPDALKVYLQQSGQTGGTGTIPVTGLTYPGQKTTPTGLSGTAGAAPGATPTPGALTPGTTPAPS
jgi:hypothetical protein